MSNKWTDLAEEASHTASSAACSPSIFNLHSPPADEQRPRLLGVVTVANTLDKVSIKLRGKIQAQLCGRLLLGLNGQWGAAWIWLIQLSMRSFVAMVSRTTPPSVNVRILPIQSIRCQNSNRVR
jgi:hypothetical protein